MNDIEITSGTEQDINTLYEDIFKAIIKLQKDLTEILMDILIELKNAPEYKNMSWNDFVKITEEYL